MRLVSVLVLCGVIGAAYLAPPCQADHLYNQPESVEFDVIRGDYLVSNYGDGSIVRINPLGEHSYFSQELTQLAGIHIVGDRLYAAANAEPYIGLVAFDLGTGEMVEYIPIPESELLNDIAHDTAGNIYITDMYAHHIYKVRASDHSYSLFVSSGLSWPNGILYDEANNRLLTISQAEAGYPMRAIDLADSTVSLVIYTYTAGVDGIVRDSEGFIYLSSWSTNALHRFAPGLAGPAEIFSTGHDGPADIFYNPYHNLIAVPNFYLDTVEWLPVNASGVDNPDVDIDGGVSINSVSPCLSSAMIQYELVETMEIRIDVLDLNGRLVETLVDGVQPAGLNQVCWDGADFSPGIYFYRALTRGQHLSKKMLLIK